MPQVLPTLANETIVKEIEDNYPVSYNAFARSAQSAETLRNAAQLTDRKRRFIVHEHDRSAALFLTVCGWKQEDISLQIISISCVYGQTGFVQKMVCFFYCLPKQKLVLDKIFTTVSSTTFVHMQRYNQHKMKAPPVGALKALHVDVIICVCTCEMICLYL